MSKVKRVTNLPSEEPMVLLERYINTLAQIKQLTKEKGPLKKQLEKLGVDPTLHTRSDYFKKPITLYVLKLEDECWYIGMTRNIDKRYKAHKKGKTYWTKEHKPIEVHETRDTELNSDSAASKLEDELTLEYARKFGMDKVRGGGYCQRKPLWPIDMLNVDEQRTQEGLGSTLGKMFHVD